MIPYNMSAAIQKSKNPHKCLPLNLPHTKEELCKYGYYEIPTLMVPIIQNAETSWTVETANFVKDMSEAVDVTHKKTAHLGNRIDGLEDKVKEIEATGAIVYDTCVRGKRVPELQPRPLTPEDENKVISEKLKEKLKSANLQLVRQRNLVQKLRDDLKFCERLLRAEVGEGFNLADPALKFGNFGGWKGRAQVIINLRAKIAVLEHELQGCHHRLRHSENEKGYDPIINRNPEVQVPKYQRDTIDKIYMQQYEKYRFQEQNLTETKEKCKDLSSICSSISARNNILSGNLKNAKAQIKDLEQKSAEDSELIRTLMQHQNVLKEIIEKQSNINQQAVIREQDLHDILSAKILSPGEEGRETESTKDIACETYKTLWQTSENTTKSLEDMVHQLQSRLDTMTVHVIEAEKHCCNHQAKLKDLESQFDQMARTGKVYVKPKVPKGSEKEFARWMLTEEELKMKKEENRLLRCFLQEALKNKSDDFDVYKKNLECTKKDYILSLQKMKKSFENPPEDEKEDDDEAQD